jgi:predicted transcriptional regulator
MGSTNYPPEKIYSPSKLKRPNYDHIILWMLNNNEMCKWADFCQEPIEIPIGTLSRHLETLKRRGFVEKIARGRYKITSEGKKKFYELSSAKKKKRELNYPPNVIIKSGRNYSHWILWMVYNNNYCKRSEFLEDPLSINQSSLSKNLSLLIEKGFIIKEDGKYIITRAGKSAYSKMLQNYDLDRQTILEEESKRIEEIAKKTIDFFDRFRIKDKEIQFRFLNNILRLDYLKVKPLLKDEEVFHKILLFFSINHPDQYPNFISSEDFSKVYKIKKTTLDYYIDQISEGKIYPLRFFKLTLPSSGVYYFQSEGKLERILQVITDNKITKNSYLNKLFSKKKEEVPGIDIKLLLNDIVDKCCEFLFHKDFKESLRELLPEYINYMAYKIETKKELKETFDRLEGIIWQDLLNAFESHTAGDLKSQYEEQIKEIEKEIELNLKNIELYNSKIKILIYFNQYNDVLATLDLMLKTFPEEEISIMMKKASILRKKKNLDGGLEIIENLIKKYPKNNELLSYKAFWLQYLNEKEKAIEIIQKLIENEPKKGIYHDYYGEILMYFEEHEEATKKFLKAIVLDSEGWYIYQTYIKLGICYKALGNHDLATKNLNTGKELTNESSIEAHDKQKWIAIADLFLAEII